jgi:hypothetical protein
VKELIPDMDIKCYAQDPAFTPLDIDLLNLLNIQVLDSNLESKVTNESFVYSPFVDWFLLLPSFLKDKSPVLYVGNEILDNYSPYAQTIEKQEKLEECNEIGRSWLQGRETVKLDEFEMHANALNGMVVYWKETEKRGAQAQSPEKIGEQVARKHEETEEEKTQEEEDKMHKMTEEKENMRIKKAKEEEEGR